MEHIVLLQQPGEEVKSQILNGTKRKLGVEDTVVRRFLMIDARSAAIDRAVYDFLFDMSDIKR